MSHQDFTRNATTESLSELICIVERALSNFFSAKQSVVVSWKHSWCDMGRRRFGRLFAVGMWHERNIGLLKKATVGHIFANIQSCNSKNFCYFII